MIIPIEVDNETIKKGLLSDLHNLLKCPDKHDSNLINSFTEVIKYYSDPNA